LNITRNRQYSWSDYHHSRFRSRAARWWVIITLERYFKIVHAIAHRKYYQNWMTKVGVVLPWFGGVCMVLFPGMGTTRIVQGRCMRLAVWPNKAMGFVSMVQAL